MDILATGALALRIAEIAKKETPLSITDLTRLKSAKRFLMRILQVANYLHRGETEGLEPEALSEFQHVSPTLIKLTILGYSFNQVKEHLEKLIKIIEMLEKSVSEKTVDPKNTEHLATFFAKIGEDLVREHIDRSTDRRRDTDEA